jgi:hypothetical protein
MPSKKPPSKNPPSDTMINFYELPKVQPYKTNVKNPNYENHKMDAIFRNAVLGASGAGKTNYIFNLITKFSDTFNHIYVFTQERETLYDYLESQISSDLLTIRYNLDDLNNCNGDFNSYFYGTSLVIFDDQVVQSKLEQKSIIQMFIRGRKVAGGVSLCYLSQSYFGIPKMIRNQLNYVTIIKISSNRDLKMILSEYNLTSTKEQLLKMYNYCCNGDFGNVFTIDLQSSQEKGMTYRRNFLEFLSPSDF